MRRNNVSLHNIKYSIQSHEMLVKTDVENQRKHKTS